jgi:L-xylulokinase
MPSLLGIDNGLTVTKAVIFDERGIPLATARRRLPQSMPKPRHVERDLLGLWKATAEAIAEALRESGRPAADVVGIAATAHGDGVYLLDRDRQPLGPGILSLDSRAGEVAERWQGGSVARDALALTGQLPHASAPSSVLAWIKLNEPERYARIGHILAPKDWLRFCLTGTIGTDRTEASTSFTDVRGQDYSLQALRIFGLEALVGTLPPIAGSAEIVGHVSREAAAVTGLAEGTPVVAGLHDVTASALGIGGHKPGVAALVAGTYSINEVVSTRPAVDERWFCRNAIAPGEWNNMAISPASAANYDWFLDRLCQADQARAEEQAHSIHEVLGPEIEQALDRPSALFFHPYLYGSPFGATPSAGFLGLRGWHDRGDMLRAVLEGIAYNHRIHVDALREGFDIDTARLTGGISRNPVFAQLFADVLNMPVTVTETEEAAAWGAALCAGAGVGLFSSPRHDPRDLATLERTFLPDSQRAQRQNERYRLFREMIDALTPVWRGIDAMADDLAEPER